MLFVLLSQHGFEAFQIQMHLHRGCLFGLRSSVKPAAIFGHIVSDLIKRFPPGPAELIRRTRLADAAGHHALHHPLIAQNQPLALLFDSSGFLFGADGDQHQTVPLHPAEYIVRLQLAGQDLCMNVFQRKQQQLPAKPFQIPIQIRDAADHQLIFS